MKRTIALRFVAFALLAVVGFAGCESSNSPVMPEETAVRGTSDASLMKVGRTQIWADCTLYNSIVTPASFNPSSEPFDILFNIGPSGGQFKDGKVLISESKPGDQDYNGGRWAVYVLKSSVDNTKYEDACRAEDLDMSDFESANAYFECPLTPINRRP